MDRSLTLTTRPDLLADQKAPPGIHEASVLLHSAAYAGLQAPLNAIVQPFGGKADTIISAPEQTKAWSSDWHMQQVGTGVGMLAPILLSRKLLTTVFPSATAKLATEKGIEALTKQEARFLARYELGISVGTGLVFGGLLTPSKLEPGQSLADARWRQAGSAGVTFGTLTLGTMGIKSLAGSSALKETTAGRWLKNDTVATALAGVPAGIVSVDAHSVFNGKGLPTLAQHFDSKYAEAVYNFSVVGAGIGYVTGPRSSKVKDNATPGMERAATDLPVGKSSRDLLAEMGDRLQATSKIPDLAIDSLPAPKVKYERDVRNLPRLKDGVDITDMSPARFEREAIERTPEPVRVYEAEGTTIRVVISETYAAKLDRFSQLKKLAEQTDAAGERARLDLKTPEMAELEGRMTVEDAFRHALMTPEPGQFREIHILETTNPYDALYRAKHGNPEFASSGDTIFKLRQTNWYRKDAGPTMVEDMMHEWGHLFDEYHPIEAQIIRIASRIDAPETRPYAKVPREQTPILVGENALHPSGRRVADLMQSSPVTAMAIAEGMLAVLARVPVERRGTLHEQFVARAQLMKNEAGPAARQTLLEIIKSDAGSPAANDALRALVFLGQPKDLQALVNVRTVDLSTEPLSDTRGTRIGEIPSPTEVDLSLTHAGPGTLRALEGKPLETLNLSGTQVTNDSLAFVPGTVRNLNLSGTKLVGDGAVPFLIRLKGLQSLDVSNTRMTPRGLRTLREALADTDITHD